MVSIDDLLGGDTDTATRAAQGAVPGFVAKMDELAPAIAAGCGRSVLLHYWMAVDGAAQRLTTLPTTDPDIAERAATGYLLLRSNAAELLWTAPTVDGTGVLTALVDRFRFLVGGLSRPPRRVRGPQHAGDDRRRRTLRTAGVGAGELRLRARRVTCAAYR